MLFLQISSTTPALQKHIQRFEQSVLIFAKGSKSCNGWIESYKLSRKKVAILRRSIR